MPIKMKVLNARVWERHWKFSKQELALLKPIFRFFSYCGYGADYNVALKINRDTFHKEHFDEREDDLVSKLKPFRFSIAQLYALVEPAAALDGFWFFRLNQRLDGGPRVHEISKRYWWRLRDLLAADSPFSSKLKDALRFEFDDLTYVKSIDAGFPDVDWSNEQIAVLKKYLRVWGYNGEERWDRKGRYAVHKAPYWRMAVKVLAQALQERGAEAYEGAQLSGKFLEFMFPAIHEKPLSACHRRDLMRNRLRYKPKVSAFRL